MWRRALRRGFVAAQDVASVFPPPLLDRTDNFRSFSASFTVYGRNRKKGTNRELAAKRNL